MSLRLATENYLVFIPRNQISKHSSGQVIITVFYRIPVLGTRGNLIMDENHVNLHRMIWRRNFTNKNWPVIKHVNLHDMNDCMMPTLNILRK